MRFIFTRRLDFVAFGLPILIALALSPTIWSIPSESVPGWAWLFLVVGVDVAHVWATLFRTYLDHRELFRRPLLYCGAPLASFCVSFALHSISSSVFWTFLSYTAIYHFIKQDIGLLFLFIARGGARMTKEQLRFEKITLYIGALAPVLAWHANPPEKFTWFRANERFLFRLPDAACVPVAGVWLATMAAYVCAEVRRWRQGVPLNPGKLYIMAMCWITWAIGATLEHEVTTLAWVNLFHGLPFFVMVGMYCRRRWSALTPADCGDRFTAFITQRWTTMLAILFALALAEELLWDLFVWQEFTPRLCFDLSRALAPRGAAGGAQPAVAMPRPSGLHAARQPSQPSMQQWCERLFGLPGDASASTGALTNASMLAASASFTSAGFHPATGDDDEGAEGMSDAAAPLLDLSVSPVLLSFVTAFLALPQLTHYILDSYIWRFDGTNPGLREYLLGASPTAVADKKLERPAPDAQTESSSSLARGNAPAGEDACVRGPSAAAPSLANGNT